MRLFMGLVVVGVGFGLATGTRAEVVPKQDQSTCCPTCTDDLSKQCRAKEAVLRNAKVDQVRKNAAKAEIAK